MKFCFLLILLPFFQVAIYSQDITPQISARVDTSKIAVKEIYHLYTNYLNSKPDSIYINPNWSEKESKLLLKKSLKLRVDRSANQMFNRLTSEKYLGYYTPTILQIDSIASDRYQVKTIFAAKCPEDEYRKFTPDFITKLYAVRDATGVFKLENALSYDTRKWKTYKHKFITYIVHPDCTFNKSEAQKAVAFCQNISKRFNIDIIPFDYYMLPNSDEMGKLYNFDYWLSYMGGQTNVPWREIFTTYDTANYSHELVHVMFPIPLDSAYNPMIINEGLATWLAGPSIDQGFEEALLEVSQTLKSKDHVSIKDIQSFKIRNEFDNNILYVTGGVICKLVYEKHGDKGVWELYKSTNEDLDKILEKLFELPYQKIDELIVGYIKSYHLRVR